VPERWWWLRPLILLAVVSAGVVLALTVGIPPIGELRSGVAAAGWTAPVLYTAIFAGLTLTSVVVARRRRRAGAAVRITETAG
jgi:hypothetical protein